jgi:hypothetical protein
LLLNHYRCLLLTRAAIPKNFAGLPEVMVLILIQTGLPGVALTLNIGQLVRY